MASGIVWSFDNYFSGGKTTVKIPTLIGDEMAITCTKGEDGLVEVDGLRLTRSQARGMAAIFGRFGAGNGDDEAARLSRENAMRVSQILLLFSETGRTWA